MCLVTKITKEKKTRKENGKEKKVKKKRKKKRNQVTRVKTSRFAILPREKGVCNELPAPLSRIFTATPGSAIEFRGRKRTPANVQGVAPRKPARPFADPPRGEEVRPPPPPPRENDFLLRQGRIFLTTLYKAHRVAYIHEKRRAARTQAERHKTRSMRPSFHESTTAFGFSLTPAVSRGRTRFGTVQQRGFVARRYIVRSRQSSFLFSPRLSFILSPLVFFFLPNPCVISQKSKSKNASKTESMTSQPRRPSSYSRVWSDCRRDDETLVDQTRL